MVNLPALEMVDLWRHSEIADKNSIFFDIGVAPLMINVDDNDGFEFNVLPLDIRIDYLPPLDLPFSLGVFINTPYPNLKHFGVRAAYHLDLLNANTDLYLAYSFDFGFIRNNLLKEYNDTPVEVHWFDFRVGVRYFFRTAFGIAVETGFKFESLTFSLSIKIN